MRRTLGIVFGCLVLLATGCTSVQIPDSVSGLDFLPEGIGYKTPVSPVRGWVFSEYYAPLSCDFNKTPVCSKSGSTTSNYVCLPWPIILDFAWENAAIAKAAGNGGVSVVEYADYRYFNVLGIYQEFTVTAYGK